jgi:hypothetical protein
MSMNEDQWDQLKHHSSASIIPLHYMHNDFKKKSKDGIGKRNNKNNKQNLQKLRGEVGP